MTTQEITATNQEITHAENVNLNIPEGYICTVDLTTTEGKIRTSNALSDATSLTEKGSEKFILKDVVSMPGVRSRTGEVCTNTYLITADNEIFMTQSDGIKRSIQQMIGIFNGDLGEGIETSVVEKSLPGGNTLKTLHFYE